MKPTFLLTLAAIVAVSTEADADYATRCGDICQSTNIRQLMTIVRSDKECAGMALSRLIDLIPHPTEFRAADSCTGLEAS